MFKLDPRLENDTFYIGDLILCKVLLMNDARYPWVILVPKVTDVTEIFELDPEQQQQLFYESNLIAERLKNWAQADKMNVAALGNVVSQLHIHHVARLSNDATWPEPVWGKGEATCYSYEEKNTVIKQLTELFCDELQYGEKTVF